MKSARQGCPMIRSAGSTNSSAKCTKPLWLRTYARFAESRVQPEVASDLWMAKQDFRAYSFEMRRPELTHKKEVKGAKVSEGPLHFTL
jgi:hypothetical protein